eukprot:CAMPEP_0197035170 /NCGR_PEP_ID=MMETSP1384-20130603/13035_1 /TAXON_ID=29189 /ORGANISM="Ammonia sp." /LENGTH=307 /DNA_ID=CAMNT_0042465195 /DNA_START=88 /DNA_END=1011 /DNA_ORIENTATION=+
MTSGANSQLSTPHKNASANNKSPIPTFNDLYDTGNTLSCQFIFVDLQKVVCDALESTFPARALKSGEVSIIQGKFESYLESNNIDCIVSSSNAFGLMDHGFDRSICTLLNDKDTCIQSKIQQEIIDKYHGEQPVGTCILVKTGNARIKYIANAPTRRVNYSIKGTDNVYMCMKAVCNEIRIWNELQNDDAAKQIRTVLLSGLGTFYGAVSPKESARQTVLGWSLARIPKASVSDMNWDFAHLRQSLIGYGGFNCFLQYIQENVETALTQKQQQQILRSLPKSVIDEWSEQENGVQGDNGKKKDCSIM